ncbi:MAG: CDP-alcohol phosphatidyltransferase family protein [Muribaculaceae bacterium]|nr:CDP-alcohol phosphatidyltransferase family protein [Muribaculaceae bacterium]
MGLAAVFDFFDGAAARWLHAPSPLGKELDSLADLVSFGVAPSLLLYNILRVWTGSWWIPFVALFIPAMGALRLAKFNLDDSQATEFKGLPIPANAIFWIGATAWMQSHGLEWMHSHVYWGNLIVSLVIISVALMMVSNRRMFSLKLKNFRFGENLERYLLITAAILFVAIWGVEGFAYTIILYIILSWVDLGARQKPKA